MNTETPVSSSAVPAYGSPGLAVREARTRQGLSLEELASRTRLARPTLEALENDAFDQLLEPVYVRGYYRKCARILGLEEQPLIEAYEAAYTPPPVHAPSRLRLAPGSDLDTTPRISGRLMLLLPVALLIIAALAWFAREDSRAPAPGASLSLSESPGLGAPPLNGPSEPAPEAAPPGSAEASAELTAPAEPSAPVVAEGVAPAAASAPVVAPAPGAPPAAAVPAPGADQLLLEFRGISWARIEDANGRSLASGVVGAGERLQLDGQPPYSVFLGNAPVVGVQFRGQSLDLAPYIKRNSTARFSVPAAGAN